MEQQQMQEEKEVIVETTAFAPQVLIEDKVDKVLSGVQAFAPESLATTQNAKIKELARKNVSEILAKEVNFDNVELIRSGVYKPTSVKLSIMAEPLSKVKKNLETKEYVESLTNLRKTLQKIDPSVLDMNGFQKLFYDLVKFIPGMDKVKNYVDERQSNIDTIEKLNEKVLMFETKTANDLVQVDDYAKQIHASFEEKFIRLLYLRAARDEFQSQIVNYEGEQKEFYEREIVNRWNRLLMTEETGYLKEYNAYLALRATKAQAKDLLEIVSLKRKSTYNELVAYSMVFAMIGVNQNLLDLDSSMDEVGKKASTSAAKAIGRQNKEISVAMTRDATEAQKNSDNFKNMVKLLKESMSTTVEAVKKIEDGLNIIQGSVAEANKLNEGLKQYDAKSDQLGQEIFGTLKEDFRAQLGQ